MKIDQVCKKPYHKDSQSLVNLFLTIADKMHCPISINQIKSTNIFPKIETESDKHTLYWDIQYWEFFDCFLLDLSRFLADKEYRDIFSNQLLALFYDYLSIKLLHFPGLAYCIQVNRKRKFNFQGENDKEYKTVDKLYEKGILYSRILVFCHEIFHLYYKLNPQMKEEDCKRLNKLAEIYCEGEWLVDVENDITASLLIDGFKALLHSESGKLLEEASCDYRALIETISIYKNVFEDNKNFLQELHTIHDIFHINQTLFSYLTNIFTCWEKLYNVYIRVDTYNELMKRCQPSFDIAAQFAIIRNSIIPDFLEKLNIKKYGMGLYTSVLNQSDIKDTICNVADKMVDLDFMFYAIEESIKLSELPDFDPFELY